MTGRDNWLRQSAVRVFGPTMVERVIDSVLADIATEYEQAARQGRVWASRRVRGVGYLTLAKVFAMCAWDRTIGILRDSTADDRLALGRTILYSAAAIVSTTLLLLLPIARRHRASLSPEQMAYFPQLLLYLVPSQLALALPIGCSLGILYGLRGLAVSLRSKMVVLVLAIACTAAAFVTVAWLLPAANQGFRELAYAEQVKRGLTPWLPPKGVPEMTFRELTQHIVTARRDGRWRVVRLSSYSYHLRWALSGATLVLALFSLSLVTRRRDGRFVLGAAACAAFFCYWLLLYTGRALALLGFMPPAPAAWLANIALALVALALLKLPPRSVRQAGL